MWPGINTPHLTTRRSGRYGPPRARGQWWGAREGRGAADSSDIAAHEMTSQRRRVDGFARELQSGRGYVTGRSVQRGRPLKHIVSRCSGAGADDVF